MSTKTEIKHENIDSSSNDFKFSSAGDYYRTFFFLKFRTKLSFQFKIRFDSSATKFSNKIANFLLKKTSKDFVTYAIEIVKLYGDGLDEQQLILYRDMLLDTMKEKPSSAADVIGLFFRENENARKFASQITKLCCLILTISATICTVRRFFSSLRRIKIFLRSTLRIDKLNLSRTDVDKMLNN